MEIYQAINHIRWRLRLLEGGRKITWSLKDRLAASSLCINVTERTDQKIANNWISVKDELPTDTLNEDGSAKYCVVMFASSVPENIIPFSVANAEYARLHPNEYDYWMRIDEHPVTRNVGKND